MLLLEAAALQLEGSIERLVHFLDSALSITSLNLPQLASYSTALSMCLPD
jgi:hypothetical protein